MVNRFPSPAPTLAVLLAAGSALGGLGWLWWSSDRRGDINFLPKRTPAEWIVYPSAADAVSHPRLETGAAFRRSFALAQAPAEAVLSVAGFYRYTVSINGNTPGAPMASGKNWKVPDRFEVSKQLRAGENQIVVAVFNTNGPPALWLALAAFLPRMLYLDQYVSNEALAAAGKARELALALGHWDVAAKNEELGRLFAARQPYRETPGARDANAP
jgi:hypothetical protein